MGRIGREETRRVARLARLDLAEDEIEGLARDLDAIAEAFGGLAARAEELPVADEAGPGGWREDVAEPAAPEAAAEILRNVPRLDASRAIRVPRGSRE